jgi:hypothetical protein
MLLVCPSAVLVGTFNTCRLLYMSAVRVRFSALSTLSSRYFGPIVDDIQELSCASITRSEVRFGKKRNFVALVV